MKRFRPWVLISTLACVLGVLPSPAIAPAGATGEECGCVAAVDTCCESAPSFTDTAYTNHFSGPVIVATREPEPGTDCVVRVFDINQNIPSEGVNWAPMNRYHGPPTSKWTGANMGTVFGLTLDEYGNIFVTSTSCYNTDIAGPGTTTGGDIWRIDAVTGVITKFKSLPNSKNPLVGLGNITYDCTHHQFFVTNLADGCIYQVKSSNPQNGSPANAIVTYYDPGQPTFGNTSGFVALGERLWGVQWHSNRVYYSVWATDFGSAPGINTIRSVGLDVNGDPSWWDDRLEIQVPSFSGGRSGPVSDISFGPTGNMLLGERNMTGPSNSGAHSARVLEYMCQKGVWVPANSFAPGCFSTQTNSAGGVDYDFAPYNGPMPPATAAPGLGGSKGRVWATSDAISLGCLTDVVYGMQGFRPTGGTWQNSLLVDFDGYVASCCDKMHIGDVESPCPPNPAGGTLGKICGQKFLDANGNGVKDGNEVGLAGWTITLTGTVNATATTDANGNYCFTGLPPGNYTVTEVTQPGWILTVPTGGSYAVTLQPPATSVVGKDFGNKRCDPNPCVKAPSGMVSWWPLDEPSANVAHDVQGPNNATWSGGGDPSPFPGQYVGNSLHFVSGYAEVNTNNGSLDFGTGSFSIDAWVRAPQGNAKRAIVDKRVVNGTQQSGYEFYIDHNQLGFGFSAGGGYLFIWPLGPVLPSATGPGWDHVAVTLDRSATPNVVTMYLNGTPYTFSTFAQVNSVSTSAKLRIGQSTLASEQAPFEGYIDEVEIFSRVLTGPEVTSIYEAGTHGKCKKQCYLPSVLTFGKNQTSMQVCFNICNNDWSDSGVGTVKSFTWTLAGLPASAPNCTVNGPTVFSPPSGSIYVAPGQCSPAICVTIQRPANLSPGSTACYQLTVQNDQTGVCFSCVGKLRATGKVDVFPNQQPLIRVPRSSPAVVDFGLHNDQTAATLDYRLDVRSAEDDGSTALVRLNGLPPGTPVTGTLSLGPDSTKHVTANLSYAGTPVNLPIQEVLISIDLDGSGTLTEASAIGVIPESTTVVGVNEPGDREDIERALGYPNPFESSIGVRFSLPATRDVRVGVYDLTGRLVRLLHDGSMSSGSHYLVWDGVDARGRRAITGVYFIRVKSGDHTVSTKVVRVK